MPKSTSIDATMAATIKVDNGCANNLKKIVTAFGQGALRLSLSYNPELPDPAFAKLIILTPDARARWSPAGCWQHTFVGFAVYESTTRRGAERLLGGAPRDVAPLGRTAGRPNHVHPS